MLIRTFAVVALAIAAVVALGLLSQMRLTSAVDDTFITTLYPGWNLIGWIEADSPVGKVFDQIPELESIRSGVQHADRKLSSGQANTMSSLRKLKRGVGYRFQVAGDRPVVWRRSVDVRAHEVELSPGFHLVAWAGKDQMLFKSAVRGLGDALDRAWSWGGDQRRLHIWNPRSPLGSTLRVPDPFDSPYGSLKESVDSHRLRRGAAVGLWLKEAVRWVQPLGETPLLKFCGAISDQVKRQAVNEMRWVTSYFVNRYGVEANHRLMRVVVSDTLRSGGGQLGECHGPLLSTGVTIPSDPETSLTIIWMPIAVWETSGADNPAGVTNRARWILLHEYYHAVQGRLSGPRYNTLPTWIVESGPTSLGNELLATGPLEERSLEVAAQFDPDDRELTYDLVERPDDWIFTLSPAHAMGHSLAIWMDSRFGRDAHFRLWRAFNKPGMENATWQDAFALAYGMSVDDLYVEFDRWLHSWYPYVEGRLLTPAGVRPAEMHLALHGTRGGGVLQVPIQSDGRFRVAAAAGGRYRFAIASEERTCAGYSTANGVLSDHDSTPYFVLPKGGIKGVTITIPETFCQVVISGRATDGDAQPVANLIVEACNTASRCGTAETDESGVFAVPTPEPGRYTLAFAEQTASCRLYYRDGSAVSSESRASRLSVDGVSIDGVEVALPKPFCGYEIRGQLLGLPDSFPLMPMNGIWDNELQIWALPTKGGHGVLGKVNSTGLFTISLSGPGEYYLSINPKWSVAAGHPLKACGIEFRFDGVPRRDIIVVTDEGHEPIAWTLPQDFCRWRVIGQVVGRSSGDGLENFPLSLCWVPSKSTGWSCDGYDVADSEGRFAMYVPYDEDFFIAPPPDEICGYSAFDGHRTYLSTEGSDISGIVLSVPDLLCPHR